MIPVTNYNAQQRVWDYEARNFRIGCPTIAARKTI